MLVVAGAGLLLALVPVPDALGSRGDTIARVAATSRRAVLGGSSAAVAGLLAGAVPSPWLEPVQASETLRGAGVAVRGTL